MSCSLSLRSVLFMFVLIFCLSVGVSAGEVLEPGGPVVNTHADGAIIAEIQKRGKLIVAQVGVNQPPFFWQENGEWRGYELDLAKQLADALGVELEILRLGEDYNEVCRVVYRGLADIGISNLSDTETRRSLVDFTQPYIVSRVAMLVDLPGLEKDGIDAIEPADLNRPDVRAGLTNESAYEFVVEELLPNATVIRVPQGDFDDVAGPVLEGKIHLVVEDGLILNLGMSQNPDLTERLYLHVFEEYDDPLSICLPHNQPKLREFINGIIQEIEAQEPVTLEYLVDKYMR